MDITKTCPTFLLTTTFQKGHMPLKLFLFLCPQCSFSNLCRLRSFLPLGMYFLSFSQSPTLTRLWHTYCQLSHSLNCHLLYDVPSKEKMKQNSLLQTPTYFLSSLRHLTLSHVAANCVPHSSVNSSMAVFEFHPVCIFYNVLPRGGICPNEP